MLSYTYYWLRKQEDDLFERAAKMLGLYWTRAGMQKMVQPGKSSIPNELFIPLSLAINPELQKGLEKVFGVTNKGKPTIGNTEAGENVVSLGEVDKEIFKQMFNQIPLNIAAPKSNQFEPKDPSQMQRMMEQLELSRKK